MSKVILDVVADDLLPARVRHAAEDADLRRRVVAGGAEDAAAVDALRRHRVDELLRPAASSPRTETGIGTPPSERMLLMALPAAAEEDVVAVLAEDEHRRFARDPLRRAVDEAVGDDVAVDDDPLPLHRLGELQQARPRKHAAKDNGISMHAMPAN